MSNGKSINADNLRKTIDIIKTKLGLTQGQIAEKIGITESHLSRVKKGKSDLGKSPIRLLEKEFGVNPDYLCGEHGRQFYEDSDVFADHIGYTLADNLTDAEKVDTQKEKTEQYRPGEFDSGKPIKKTASARGQDRKVLLSQEGNRIGMEKGRVIGLESQMIINAMQKTIDTLEDRVEDLKSMVENLTVANVELKVEIERLKKESNGPEKRQGNG